MSVRVTRCTRTPHRSPTKNKELPVSRVEGLEKRVRDVLDVQLPKEISHVFHMFNELEKVCVMTFSLGKRITLDLVKKNIARNCQRAFNNDLMGKILAIYPESYHIELEKDRFTKPGQPEKYDIVLKPNLKDDLGSYYREEYTPKSPSRSLLSTPTKLVSPTKKPQNLDYIPSPPRSPRKGQAVPLPRELKLHLGPKFEGWRKDCRSAIMKYKLWQYLWKEHDKFLESNPCEDLKPDMFHPKFIGDRVDITPIELPKPKKPARQLTMMDYLKKVPVSGILKSVEKVTEELQSPEKKVKMEAPIKPSVHKMSLLDRIREKARETEEKEKRKDHKMIERVSVLETLQKAALTVICSEYSNRRSMDSQELYKRLNFSIQTRKDQFERMISILSEIASSHIDVIHLNERKYVKVIDNDRSKLNEIVNAELERCKKQLTT